MSFLFLESSIAARLREHLPAEVHVLASASIDDLAKGSRLAPATYLIYAGGAVAEARPDGRAVRVRQNWLVVVTARHAARLTEGAPARADAGALADLVLAALMGWQPDGTSQPLTLADLPDPGFLAGYQTIPLVFSTEFVRANRA